MKLTSIELQAANLTDKCELSFRDPRSENPYQVRGVTGLDADDIVASYYSAGTGRKYHNLSLKERVVTMKMGFNPRFDEGESFSSLRDDIYRLIATSRTGEVNILFKNGNVTVGYLTGFVTKVEADTFTNDPDISVTVKCDYPMIRTPSFEMIDASSFNPLDTTITDNVSTAPHGMAFQIRFVTNASSFWIRDNIYFSDWRFEIADDFRSGDILWLANEYKTKELYVIRDGVVNHLADRVVSGSIWPMMFPKDNHFVMSPGVAWESIFYVKTFWGI